MFIPFLLYSYKENSVPYRQYEYVASGTPSSCQPHQEKKTIWISRLEQKSLHMPQVLLRASVLWK